MGRAPPAIVLCAALASACIDFREGLQCRDNDDCRGLICVASVCEAGDGGNGSGGSGGGSGKGASFESATPFGDNNGDGAISPGETAGLQVQIRNTGTAVLTGSLTTTKAGVTITRGTGLKFGNTGTACGIASSSGYNSGTCFAPATEYPAVAIASTIAAGTVIPFVLVLTQPGNASQTLNFSYTTPAISQTFSVVSSTPVGDDNGDGALSPGENAGLMVRIQNTGNAKALAVTGSLSTTRAGVTVTNGTGLKFGDVATGSTCGISATSGYNAGTCFAPRTEYPTVTVSQGLPASTDIVFALTLRDAYGNSSNLNLNYVTPAINQAFSVLSSGLVGDTNGNGALGASETAGLMVRINNTGSAKAIGLTASLTTSNGAVSVVNGTNLKFGDISSSSSGCGVAAASGYSPGTCFAPRSEYPLLTASSSLSAGSLVPFTLVVKDKYGNTFNLNFSLTAG